MGAVDITTDRTDCDELWDGARLAHHNTCPEVREQCLRVVLLTPYTGGNLGDAAIQDAMIANLRLRLPAVQISGISLNCDNFVERHGTRAFPLCETHRPFYGMVRGSVGPLGNGPIHTAASDKKGMDSALKRSLKQMPVFLWFLKAFHTWVTGVLREFRHCIEGYQFLRNQDLVIVSGGGQLDEEWGGPWGHPYALFKWAVLARIAGVPYAIASVGACKVPSTSSRMFLSAALRMAQYRSFRDNHSREFAASLLRRAAEDPVVPDLAFTLTSWESRRPASIQSISGGRPVVAISPIAYGKPGSWPSQDRTLYNRYLEQMAQVVSQLLKHGYFLLMVWSSLGDDQGVIPELLGRLDEESHKKLLRQMHVPSITTWKDFVGLIQEADFLIASRLHSTILGFVAKTPTVAISFDPKVDWVMEDLCQTDYLLHIRDFTAEDVIQALHRIELHRNAVLQQIASYRPQFASVSARQYDALVALAVPDRRS
jgi:polysaccharide pyruvyl transferase WcaK-like protein